ncbi:spermidine synthase, partial [Streptomyces sp. NPDC052127]
RTAGPDTAGGSRAPRDWGFVLATADTRPPLRLDRLGQPPRTLTQAELTADARAAEATRVTGLRPSTLVHPRY